MLNYQRVGSPWPWCHSHPWPIHGPFPSLPTFQSPVRLALGVGGMILQFEMLSTPESPATLWWTNILPWKDPPFLMGKLTISPFFIGKLTISMAIFNCYLYVHQAGYVQTGLTQVSQLSQRYQDWWKETQTIGHRRTLLILVRQQIKSSYDVSSWSLSKRPSAIKVSGSEFQRWNW